MEPTGHRRYSGLGLRRFAFRSAGLAKYRGCAGITRGECVVGHLCRTCGPVQRNSRLPSPPRRQIVCRIDDQPRARLVDLGSTPQHVGAVDSELAEGAFHRPRPVISVKVWGCVRGAVRHLVFLVGAEVAAAESGGRGGECATRRAGGFGGGRNGGSDLPGGVCSLTIVGQQPFDACLGRPAARGAGCRTRRATTVS